MKCPICGQETIWQNNPNRPFCSEKCQLIDLGKWALGDYKIDGNPLPELDKQISLPNTDESLHSKFNN